MDKVAAGFVKDREGYPMLPVLRQRVRILAAMSYSIMMGNLR